MRKIIDADEKKQDVRELKITVAALLVFVLLAAIFYLACFMLDKAYSRYITLGEYLCEYTPDNNDDYEKILTEYSVASLADIPELNIYFPISSGNLLVNLRRCKCSFAITLDENNDCFIGRFKGRDNKGYICFVGRPDFDDGNDDGYGNAEIIPVKAVIICPDNNVTVDFIDNILNEVMPDSHIYGNDVSTINEVLTEYLGLPDWDPYESDMKYCIIASDGVIEFSCDKNLSVTYRIMRDSYEKSEISPNLGKLVDLFIDAEK